GLSRWRGMTVITMSRDELTRLRVLIHVADGRLSVADATGLIGVGRRQIYRLLQAFRADGADGLISRKRGGPSNRALGSVFRETVLAIVRERYADFGPTLAAEKLSELCRRRHQPPDAPEVRRDRINLRLLPGDPRVSREEHSGSHATLCWRKPDSNHRSRGRPPPSSWISGLVAPPSPLRQAEPTRAPLSKPWSSPAVLTVRSGLFQR